MPTKLLTQEELTAQNTALGRTQVNTAPANVGVSIKNEPITAASLESTTPITVPPAPTDTTDYSALLKGGQAAVDFYTNKQKEAQQSSTDINSLFKQYLGSSEAPPPVADLYSSEYEKRVAPQEEATVQAQSELDAINAELAGISAEAQAIPIKVEKDSIGRRSVSDAQGITRSQLRDLALRALPLQAQAIAAQAKLTGNTNLLRLAQDKLNTVFQLRSKDAENQYNYKKDLRDKVWDFLSASEKSRVESLQREDDRKFEMFKLATNNQNVLSRTALENGQGALAAQITALDPNSRTYTQDLAALQGQITQETKAPEVKDINGVSMQWNPTTKSWQSIAGVPGGDTTTAPTIDPVSNSILAQTGLSGNAFFWLTGRASQLPRDQATRNAAAKEATAWANEKGIDISTLPAQYEAYNKVLSFNTTRQSMAVVQENEILGTLQNLSGVAPNGEISGLRWSNVAKIWAGQEVNDPVAQQYAFHLEQLRNEIVAYNLIAQGQINQDGSLKQASDAEIKRAEDVIKNGVAKGSLTGLQTAVTNSTDKMKPILQTSLDSARKAVWSLFGVGGNFKSGEPPPPNNEPPPSDEYAAWLKENLPSLP